MAMVRLILATEQTAARDQAYGGPAREPQTSSSVAVCGGEAPEAFGAGAPPTVLPCHWGRRFEGVK